MANMNMNPSTDNNQNTANNGLQVAIIQKAKYTKDLFQKTRNENAK